MQNYFKKFFAAMMALMLILSMLPAFAFAENAIVYSASLDSEEGGSSEFEDAEIAAPAENDELTKDADVYYAPEQAGSSDLSEYLQLHGGSRTLTLFDEAGNTVTQLVKGENYKLVDSIYLPNGILPGVYTTSINASGIEFSAGDGKFTFSKNGESVTIGEWTIDTAGNMKFVFYDNANDYTDVRIYASIDAGIEEKAEQVVFDGVVYVVIKPSKTFSFTKFAGVPLTDVDNDPIDKNGSKITSVLTDPQLTDSYQPFNRVFWNIKITGDGVKKIAGHTVTDTVAEGTYHSYTESDRKLGIRLFFTDENGARHNIRLSESDLNYWNATGWSFTFPAEIDGAEVKDIYDYTFYFYSTVDSDVPAGNIKHTNNATFDDIPTSRDIYQNRTPSIGSYGLIKGGSIDDITKTATWTLTGNVKGSYIEGENVYYNRYLISDISNGFDGKSYKYEGNFDPQIVKFTMEFDGKTYDVPEVNDATADDLFCYKITNLRQATDSSVSAGFYIMFGMRCNCTDEHCGLWKGGKCTTDLGNGFCSCWQSDKGAKYTITYTTDCVDMVQAYGGTGIKVRNIGQLVVKTYDKDRKETSAAVASSEASVPLNGVFNKELTVQPTAENGYTASYKITVNEGCTDLTNFGDITIEDSMSDTLVYIPGTIKVTQTDTQGNVKRLAVNNEFKISYDADSHKLTINLVDPGAYKYVIEYDALIIMAEGQATIDYFNSATIEISGNKYFAEAVSKTLAEISLAAENYQVGIKKTDSSSGKVLSGAVFGLFAANGEKITEGTTDNDGIILFKTDVAEGIVLRKHVPYYVQELSAPSSYTLDNAKRWFYFCTEENSCALDANVKADEADELTRIYSGWTLYQYNITNDQYASLSGKKIWNDADNQDGIRPASVTVRLMNGVAEVASFVVSAENNWSWSIDNLPKYADGKEINYTVVEDAVEGYTPEINGYDVTNTHTPGKVEVSFVKVWEDNNNQDGIRPASIKVNLFASGEKIDTVTVTSKDNYSGKFTDLDEYANGKKIVYTISEDEIPGYVGVVTKADGNDYAFTITNHYDTAKTELEVSKVWDDNGNKAGLRPESITVVLYKNGEPTEQSVTLKAEDNWAPKKFENLNKFENGTEIAYTVVENTVEGYTAVYDGGKITNTLIVEKISVTATKVWNDKNNAAGKRASYGITLYADGEPVGYEVVLGKDTLTYTWTNLPKFNGDKEIVYTVKETTIPAGYTSKVEGYTITNTYNPSTPSDDTPKTNDVFDPLLWIALMLTSGIALFGAVCDMKRRDEMTR